MLDCIAGLNFYGEVTQNEKESITVNGIDMLHGNMEKTK